MESMIKDFSIKGLSKRILEEIEKEEWNYRCLVEHFLIMGLKLSSMTDDYEDVVCLAKKWGYLLSWQYEADPMEWADSAGVIGSMRNIISKIHEANINIDTSETERQVKERLCNTVKYLSKEIPKCDGLNQLSVLIADALRKMIEAQQMIENFNAK